MKNTNSTYKYFNTRFLTLLPVNKMKRNFKKRDFMTGKSAPQLHCSNKRQQIATYLYNNILNINNIYKCCAGKLLLKSINILLERVGNIKILLEQIFTVGAKKECSNNINILDNKYLKFCWINGAVEQKIRPKF